MSGYTGNNPALAVSNAVADAVERAAAVTVMVDARRRLPLSGIIYAADLVLTADHGIEREEEIRVGLPDGKEASAVIVGRDRSSDLALLRVSGVSLTPAQAAGQELRVGNLVLAVGRPSPEGVQASFGMVTALGGGLRMRRSMIERYIIADAVPYPGFSGGPLVDLAGGILGINTSGLARGTSLTIPLGLAWQIADNLGKHGHVKHGYLGIRSQPVEIPAQSRAVLGRDQAEGLLVVGVEPDGPSASSLMVGDILVGMGGEPVRGHDDLLSRLTGEVVGKSAALQVLRGGQLQTVDVTVIERPIFRRGRHPRP